MAKYSIYSADGTIVRFTGTPRYNGVFGKPSYIEFTEISSPTPIDWAIGDYVEYTRTGHTYRLYSIPQPKKQAEKNKYGASFIYRNVQFYAATKDLTIAPFRDLILNDNLIHYSTLPDVSTFEDVYGIADRIQACLNDLYPDKWIVRVKEMTDPTDELYIKLHEVQEFVVSNGTCLDALDKVYQQWKGIGWVHTFENGKEVITIGRPNIRDAENTTSVFSYKGNGLTVIARENSRSNEFATRLYAYGSDRNMIARYYNNLSPVIHNAESVYLPNVMLPRAFWGTTDGKKDARKAYIQADAATIAKYGIIPKIVYFNSDEYGDIYPSIERVTAKNIRDAKTAMGDTAYVPNTTIYPDNTPIDEIKSVANPTDNGIVNAGGNKYISENTYNFAASSVSFTGRVPAKIKDTDRPIFLSIDELTTLLSQTNSQAELLLITPNTTITLTSTITISYASVMLDLVVNGKVYESLTLFEGSINDTTKTIDTTAFKKHYIPTNAEYKLVPRVLVKYDRGTTKQDYTLTANVAAGTVDVSAELALSTTFNLRIKQIGFDISKQASSSQGLATMSFKSGNCAGRDFTIQKCTYNAATDDWSLTILRSADDTLGQLFPNSIYPITTGDKFVFTDMVMPPIYIYLAESKLAEKATDLLTYLSSPKPVYTPEIDAKKMAESPQTLIEGMYMHLTDTDIIVGDEYVLIDTLTIDESGTIPTYSVTLRDEKKSSLQNLKKKLGFPITPRDTGRQDEGLPVDLLTRSGDTTITKNYYGNDGLDSVNIVMSHQSRLFEAGEEYAVEGSDTITFYAYRGIDIIPFTFGEIQNSVSGVTVTTENNTATVTIADTVSTPFGIIVFPIIAAGETYNLQYSWALSFKGSSGMNGCPLRGVTEWKEGRHYQGGNPQEGDEYQDVVLYPANKKYYVCIQTHNSTATSTPVALLGTHWKEGSQFDFVATKVFYSQKALIENAIIDTLQTQTVNDGYIEAVGDSLSSYKNKVLKLKIHSGNLSPLTGGGNNTYNITSSSKTHNHTHTGANPITISGEGVSGEGESTLATVNPTLEYNQVSVPSMTIEFSTNASEANGTRATVYWSLVFGGLVISNGVFTASGNLTSPAKTISLPKGVNSTLKLYYSYELMSRGEQVSFTLTSPAKTGNAITYIVSGFTEMAADGFKSQWASNKYFFINLTDGMKMQYGNARLEFDATNGLRASHKGLNDTFAIVGKEIKEIKVVTAMPSTPEDNTLYILRPQL